ncbi:hypothetical protein FPOAC1_012551 [Fusarium poae]|uniref:Uncharacterized protein n=1 Tax=Fusarium poae TaxID=36050 RepID=A0A1B8AHE8_FUSPO|nr:hypothetical protein FPOAC1_012551 [Fusarium poae]KAG8667715.1 hypothetical protein FPOAC1_012551 [Fusarium poae]OBS19939.1 hypothetical protein FPOA_11664 [Fusarium poae]
MAEMEDGRKGPRFGHRPHRPRPPGYWKVVPSKLIRPRHQVVGIRINKLGPCKQELDGGTGLRLSTTIAAIET